MGKTIKLISSDGEKFEVEEAVAFQSNIIKSLADEDDCIPLPLIHSQVLKKVLEYCRKHANAPSTHTKFEGTPGELCPKHASAASASSSESSSVHSPGCNVCYDEVMKLIHWDLEFVKMDLDVLHHLLKVKNNFFFIFLFYFRCRSKWFRPCCAMDSGSELSGHRRFGVYGPWGCRKCDQREASGRDSQAIPPREWLYAGGRGRDAEGASLGVRLIWALVIYRRHFFCLLIYIFISLYYFQVQCW